MRTYSSAETCFQLATHNLHPRQRLFDLLDRARRHPLVWVAGPGGSGKTSLVADFVERNSIAAFW